MPKNITYTKQQDESLIEDLLGRMEMEELSFDDLKKQRDIRDAAAIVRAVVELEETARLASVRAAKKTPAPPPSV